MSLSRPHERGANPVVLAEWEHIGPGDNEGLKGATLKGNSAAQRLAESLRSRIDIREGYAGLEITSTSFVGRIDVGAIRLAIQPKLGAAPLSVLLRYAYELRDISIVDKSRVPTTCNGLQDLLVSMLAEEIGELVHRGLSRRYIPISERLESPRGRILIDEFSRQGGLIEPRLRCRYFERRVNWQLNQVLHAGLSVASRLTEDRELRRRLRQLLGMFGDVDSIHQLRVSDIDRAERALTRLTAANAASLTLIRLLVEMQGVAFETASESARMFGFLFDMNRFFQRLLSRFLRENLRAQRIIDERAIDDVFAHSKNANPRNRSAPRPRPDYALLRGNQVHGFIDAKYRDIWEKGLPAGWLYQMAVYALASRSRVSIVLYATTASEARDEQIEVREPVMWSNKGPAYVILRPVLLPKLAELLRRDRSRVSALERERLADELVTLVPHAHSATAFGTTMR